MTQIKNRKRLCAYLLVSTCLIAPAHADDALEARVDALERKLDLILERMDQGASLSAVEGATVRDAAGVILSEGLTVADTTPKPLLVELDTPGGVSAQSTPATPRPAGAAEPTTPKGGLGFTAGGAEFNFKGFVKLDATVTDFSGGDLPSSSIGRDFYIPGLVPVGGVGDGPDFDFNTRESRFIFDVKSERGGHTIGGLIELDFQVTSDGNERVSNSFTPRMRQAYVTFDNWLLGQAWSTFQDVSALPDNLDFIGPTEGTVFIRQPMIRYTKGPWQIALEQPETEVTGPAGERLLPGDDIAPDIVLRYNHKDAWGHISLAAVGRALHVEDNIVPGAVSDTSIGYGVSASGKIKLGKRDDFRFMATHGDGVGRYIGVNIVNDVAVGETGELETIKTLSGFASLRHFWTPTLRTNITGGYFRADNPVQLVGEGVTDRVYSVHANLIYTPVDKVDIGVEYIYANRRLENGLSGDMNRVQFSTKYSF